MKYKLTDKGPRLDENKIAAFETRHGIHLPTEYRDFLLQTNGGIPNHDVAFTFRESGRASNSVLNQFYILKKGADDSNLDEALETFVEPGRMPPNLLPIADDQFGNQVCISIRGKDRGAVYFWNHECEPEPAEDGSLPAFDNISRVASRFNDFWLY